MDQIHCTRFSVRNKCVTVRNKLAREGESPLCLLRRIVSISIVSKFHLNDFGANKLAT